MKHGLNTEHSDRINRINRMERMKPEPAPKRANPVNPVHPVKNPCFLRGQNSRSAFLNHRLLGTEPAKTKCLTVIHLITPSPSTPLRTLTAGSTHPSPTLATD